MTNYNERLDEILDTILSKQVLLNRIGQEPFDEAKQALTSLIKELVAEAKPVNKQGEIDINEPRFNDSYYSGARNTLKKYEQNILKALEDK